MMCLQPAPKTWISSVLSMLIAVAVAGCGTTKSRTATQQLIISDAVDRSISELDFRYLAGKSVFLDTTYLRSLKVPGLTNSPDYITSSLRQQLFAANCLVQDEKAKADYIVEARVGALGADSHDVTYGLPASTAISSAANLVPNTPPIPAIPEISIAKRNTELGAAKISVFAYHQKTKQPVWQSGTRIAKSSARDIYVLGAGPFQSGSIYDKTQFAGSQLEVPSLFPAEGAPEKHVSVSEETHFILKDKNPIQPIGYEKEEKVSKKEAEKKKK